MFISNNRASFHFWWKENLVKHQNLTKYYENDCTVVPSTEGYFFVSYRFQCKWSSINFFCIFRCWKLSFTSVSLAETFPMWSFLARHNFFISFSNQNFILFMTKCLSISSKTGFTLRSVVRACFTQLFSMQRVRWEQMS